jgi:RNA polymerase sigma factor (sigma-70 family)
MNIDDDDSIIWKKFKDGDEKSLSFIFSKFYKPLYSYGIKIISNEELVKDCIQDLFFKLWNVRNNLMDVVDIKTYLLKALRNHIIDKLRSPGKWILKKDISEAHFEAEISHEDFMISEQFTIEQANKVSKALNQLTKRQREAIYLKYFENQDYDKIAEIMDLNVQSVRNLVFESLKILKLHINILILLYIQMSNSSNFTPPHF